MKLLVIRHAIAIEPEDWAATQESDDRRPLTEEGRTKMRRAVGALEELVPHLDLLATSPYRRAVETAEIVASQYKKLPLAVVDALIPERPYEELAEWLRRLDDVMAVAIVGHEPHLSGFVTHLIAGSHATESRVLLKKGSACLLEVPPSVEPGSAQMLWLIQAKQLREIA